ncbi:hypothetical protein V1280_003841 [Bradyrhizobium sp. AZCC 2230]
MRLNGQDLITVNVATGTRATQASSALDGAKFIV